MDQTPVEAQVVGAGDASAQYGDFAVDGETAGADPVFGFAAGCDSQAGQDFLEALAFGGVECAWLGAAYLIARCAPCLIRGPAPRVVVSRAKVSRPLPLTSGEL